MHQEKNPEFQLLLSNLQSSHGFAQSAVIKAITAYIPEAKSDEVEALLEFLVFTNDIEIQRRLLSILTLYLINNGIHYRIIIKYNPMYDTIQNLLIRELPLKAAVAALTFVVTLLRCADVDCLASHARNQIRLSGCLNAMAGIFCSSMLHQDTWVILCQSLAEACNGSEVNQSYCSHLVPLCIQRGNQGSVDVCVVLQSLLHNHDRNIEIFLKHQGISIFTRRALQHDKCIQLLSTVVARSADAAAALQCTDVVYHLQDFLHLYGPNSQMGLWSRIILFHLNRTRGSTILTTTATRDPSCDDRNEGNEAYNGTDNIDLTRSQGHTRNTQIKQHTFKRNLENQRSVFLSKRDDTFRAMIGPVQCAQRNSEDTTEFFQKVTNEINYWKSKEQTNAKRPATPLIKPKPMQNRSNVIQCENDNIIPNRRQRRHEDDLTFSFLNRENRQYSEKPSGFHNAKRSATPVMKHKQMQYGSKRGKNNNIIPNRRIVEKELSFSFLSEENGQYSEKPADFHHAKMPENPLVHNKPMQYGSNSIQCKNNNIIPNRRQESHEQEFSFSPVAQEIPKYSQKTAELNHMDKIIDSFLTDSDKIHPDPVNEHELQEQSEESNFKRNNFKQSEAFKYFDPPFKSTPKRLRTSHSRSCQRSVNSRKLSRNYTKISIDETRKTKTDSLNPTRDIKHTSMGARIFNAINESCTTFVKSVKNIFRSKPDTNKDKTLSFEYNNECSYSFTNYMRKRDALLEKDLTVEDSSSGNYKVDSCYTCKDTIILQQKMVRDDDLKLTVKKLKKGIHLYGCDFKKISRALWPRDKYMTPERLKNLYRKLIVKGGHGDHEFLQKAYSMRRK